MGKTEWFEKATQSILDSDEEAAVAIAKQALAAGMDPFEMINEGFSEGLRKVGDLFDRGDIFLPEVIIASEAMVAAVHVLEEALPKEEKQQSLGKVVIGTIEGDVHDIGKGIVATMLRVYGFEVYDLGRDVAIDAFVSKVQEVGADAVGSSALMTTTQAGQKKLEQALKTAGIRDKVKTMVGGAVATEHWANKIGADMYAETATEAVMKLKEILS
ncbi:MAG: corrinoid protein [Deltaproteobacteria bacterium]|nr:corrinoid protein [Deltaproteobacteria bacterium]